MGLAQFINVIFVPLMVIVTGLVIAHRRKRKMRQLQQVMPDGENEVPDSQKENKDDL
jgi:hypothetical protein